MITRRAVRYAQRTLTAMGLDCGPVDGDLGPLTLAALNQVAGVPEDYSPRRKLVAFLQQHARERGIDAGAIDGYWGPQTEFAFEQLEHIEAHGAPAPPWRRDGMRIANPHGWPSQRTDAELIDFYGEPGEALVGLELPYPHRLSWNPSQSVTRLQCHARVRDSIGRVLDRVLGHYGHAGIRELRLDLWGGCFNKRRMRGGERWSMHSWGIALDYDPTRNKLEWGRDRALLARPDYDAWWGFWEAEGWISLGRERNFDWMHVQAATL